MFGYKNDNFDGRKDRYHVCVICYLWFLEDLKKDARQRDITLV